MFPIPVLGESDGTGFKSAFHPCDHGQLFHVTRLHFLWKKKDYLLIKSGPCPKVLARSRSSLNFDFTPSVPPILPSFSMDPSTSLPTYSLLTFGLSTFGVRAHCPQVTERPGGPRFLQLSTKRLHGLTGDSVVSKWQQFQNHT